MSPASAAGPILLVGCGKMGGALVAGWRTRGIAAEQIAIVEPNDGARAAAARLGVRVLSAAPAPDPAYPFAAIVLAVKPQVMGAVAPLYRPLMAPGPVALSIAAGITTAGLKRHLGDNAAIVRAMPNTPAAVGRGMTVMFAGGGVTRAQSDLCVELMGAVGEVRWIADEMLMDAVTAVSGSGPAYVFYLIEALAMAGADAGLDPALAADLARATVIGSGELARLSPDPAAKLRTDVTSPGGTTEAALKVLMADPGGLKELMTRA
ncbi:MAG TPA: pyrroline-5-carboxylate reductase, partial [Alphaproteobacteria bacterium]|nr:pyrroline-5-carboxylate reductase [Alphaproteobacteria bacterium]